MLIHHLNKQVFGYLDKRDEEVAELKTKEDWIRRQKKVKDILMIIIGPFPEKTSLNPKVTGVVQKQGYRIEKIIFESMSGFYSCLGTSKLSRNDFFDFLVRCCPQKNHIPDYFLT